MTDYEIACSYRAAMDQAAQVKILADLNLTSRKKMAEHLRSLGFDVPERVGKPRKRPRKAKFDKAKAERLYRQGYMDKEIAAACDVAKFTVFKWRHNNGLEAWGNLKHN